MDFDALSYVVGHPQTVRDMPKVPALAPFSGQAVDFLHGVSQRLQTRESRAFSDVATFAFWCRQASLMREREKYGNTGQRLGLGVAFHSTPSNVPVNFAFSFAAGLLAGNANIVRLPGRDFRQVELIGRAVNEMLEARPEMKPYVVMVKYPPSSKEISDYFSAICDARLVWGGDQTIARMRQSPLPPRAREITFADRYSIMLLQSEAVLQTDSLERLARDFYNDTYFSDQNACSSPSLIVWLGRDKRKAKECFWSAVAKLKNRYSLAPVQAVAKLKAFYLASAARPVRLVPAADNFITRVEVEALDGALLDFKEHSGFFFEYEAEDLAEILPVCTGKCQTVTYYGLDKHEIADFIIRHAPRGVDRIVPVGQSLNFSLTWDGYDLITGLSRVICL